MYGACMVCMVIQVSSGEYVVYVIVFHGISSTAGWIHDRKVRVWGDGWGLEVVEER